MTGRIRIHDGRVEKRWVRLLSWIDKKVFKSIPPSDFFTNHTLYIYIYMYVTPRVHTATTRRSGSRTQDSSAGGGRSNEERQRLQPLASVTRAPLFEVRRVRFTHSPYWHSYICYTHPPKPHSHPGHGTNVTPPGPHCHNSSERVSNPGFRCGRRASNKERQRLQPLASVARAPLFEVRRVRFTHSPYWHSYIRYIIYIYEELFSKTL